MSGAAPLRFLGIVLGGWVAVRAAFLAPAWWASEGAAPSLAETAAPRANLSADPPPAYRRPVETVSIPREQVKHVAASAAVPKRFQLAMARAPAPPPIASVQRPPQIFVEPRAVAAASAPVPLPPAPRLAVPSRWSVSAWALVRQGEGGQLAPGGTLGGSQAGARITYRLRDRLFISGRFYAPLNEPDGAEGALGIEWQPLRSVPVRLLAERRQAIGGGGRSAFALLAHGGLSERPVLGPVTLDAYAQAGVVGTKSRDAFADGAVRLSVPVGKGISIGAAAWGAVQPGVSRLDLGPQASYRLPALGGNLRVAAEWRVRVAGDARPGSGPALTLSTDF